MFTLTRKPPKHRQLISAVTSSSTAHWLVAEEAPLAVRQGRRRGHARCATAGGDDEGVARPGAEVPDTGGWQGLPRGLLPLKHPPNGLELQPGPETIDVEGSELRAWSPHPGSQQSGIVF